MIYFFNGLKKLKLYTGNAYLIDTSMMNTNQNHKYFGYFLIYEINARMDLFRQLAIFST